MRFPGIEMKLPPARRARDAWMIYLARKLAHAFVIHEVELDPRIARLGKQYPNKRRLHKARYRSTHARRGRTRRRALMRLVRYTEWIAALQQEG